MNNQVQTHFFDKLKRSVTLAADRKEPLVWFQEIRILNELSPKKEAERRRITLHRGLNVLWAAPEDPDIEQGLYRDGLAGHASGKTLFCRLLRHLLGEESFGTKAQHEAIASHFLSLWLVGAIKLLGKSWIVGRSLALNGPDFAVQAESIDEVLNGTPPSGGFKDYLDALNLIGQGVEKLHPKEGWRHLLPWLSRDQEARFSNLTAWRDSASGGDNPQTKTIERHQLMREVLGLLDTREPALRSSIENDQGVFEKTVTELFRLENEITGQRKLAMLAAREFVTDDPPLEEGALRERLQSMVEVLKDGIEILRKSPETPIVKDARNRLDEARGKMQDAEAELQRIPKEIQNKENEKDRSLLIVRKVKTGNVEDPAREANNWCPHTIQTAIKRECVKPRQASTESILSIADLERQVVEVEQEISSLKRRESELKLMIPILSQAYSEADSAYNVAQQESMHEAFELARKVERVEAALELFQKADSFGNEREIQQKSNQTLQQEIEKKKKRLTDLRIFMDDRLQHFSSIFSDIIRAVMGASVEAKVTITADGFVTHVTRNSELSGAALDTIKTLAFDMAAVVASMEGRGEHPRFLIHDGPREGDMARVIYERFFIYASELETIFKTRDDSNFQYIITTTSPPPVSMREANRWLLDPVLDSRQKEGRLLGEDF